MVRNQDRIDGENMYDWMRLRNKGRTWVELATADMKALEWIDHERNWRKRD
jgi:hypothetical protein